ncbi:hypothetical protein CDD83_4424 [Cordyceps sp. RAO-2017]|nr:hypothetical protein CDD83_4424 [Cordyceps sp. RAO-2017]
MPAIVAVSRTAPADATRASLVARQATVTVVSTGNGAGGSSSGTDLSGGAIAGIVIGSIVGLLLLLWIIRSCMNLGAPPQERESLYHDVDPKRYRHDSRRRRRRHSHASDISLPPAVVIRDYSHSRYRQPNYVYPDPQRGRRR